MSFVSLAVIIILSIVSGAILMSMLRGVMYFIVAILSVGVAYYLFLATPQQKATMDMYTNKVTNSIYHLDTKKINGILNKAKENIIAAKETAEQKIKELKNK